MRFRKTILLEMRKGKVDLYWLWQGYCICQSDVEKLECDSRNRLVRHPERQVAKSRSQSCGLGIKPISGSIGCVVAVWSLPGTPTTCRATAAENISTFWLSGWFELQPDLLGMGFFYFRIDRSQSSSRLIATVTMRRTIACSRCLCITWAESWSLQHSPSEITRRCWRPRIETKQRDSGYYSCSFNNRGIQTLVFSPTKLLKYNLDVFEQSR